MWYKGDRVVMYCVKHCVSMMEGMVIYLFWARIQRCALISDASVGLIDDAIASNSLFVFLVFRNGVTLVVFMSFIFCLMCASVMSFDVRCVFVVVQCSFFCLGDICFVREWNGCVRCCDFCLDLWCTKFQLCVEW